MGPERCILVADDNDSFCVLIKKAAEDTRITLPVLCVPGAEELLNHLRSCEKGAGNLPCPAVIILDLKMPGKNGEEVLREIKSSEAWKDIPVIVWSNYPADISEKIKALGADEFAAKPAGFQEFRQFLLEIIKTKVH